jgi:tetrahydromethanopterin S-methyltransferase subunit F
MQPSAQANLKKRKRNEVSELEIPDDLMQQEQLLTRNQQLHSGRRSQTSAMITYKLHTIL